jgi:hypothetical protein
VAKEEENFYPALSMRTGSYGLDQATALRFAAKNFFEFEPNRSWYSFFSKIENSYPQFSEELRKKATKLLREEGKLDPRYLCYIGFSAMRKSGMTSFELHPSLIRLGKDDLPNVRGFELSPLSDELVKKYLPIVTYVALAVRNSRLLFSLFHSEISRDWVINHWFSWLKNVESRELAITYLNLLKTPCFALVGGSISDIKASRNVTDWLVEFVKTRPAEGLATSHYSISIQIVYFMGKFSSPKELSFGYFPLNGGVDSWTDEQKENFLKNWIHQTTQVAEFDRRIETTHPFFSELSDSISNQYWYLEATLWNPNHFDLYDLHFVEKHREIIKFYWDIIKDFDPWEVQNPFAIYAFQLIAFSLGKGDRAFEIITKSSKFNKHSLKLRILAVISWLFGDETLFDSYFNLRSSAETDAERFIDLWLLTVSSNSEINASDWEPFVKAFANDFDFGRDANQYTSYILMTFLFAMEGEISASEACLQTAREKRILELSNEKVLMILKNRALNHKISAADLFKTGN